MKRTGSKVSIWGYVRPARGSVVATITYADGKNAFKKLRTVKTDSRGYFTVSSTWRKNRRWNLHMGEPERLAGHVVHRRLTACVSAAR